MGGGDGSYHETERLLKTCEDQKFIHELTGTTNECIECNNITNPKVYLDDDQICKDCNYYFTVNKIGKKIDDYYVNKALQLYLEGLTYREIERILGLADSVLCPIGPLHFIYDLMK